MSQQVRRLAAAGLRGGWGIARALRGGPSGDGRGAPDASPSSFLADAGLVLAGTLDPEHVPDLLAGLAVPRFGTGAMVWARDGDDVRLDASVFVDPKVDKIMRAVVAVRHPTLADDFPPGIVLRNGQTYCLPDFDRARASLSFPHEPVYQQFRRIQGGPTVNVPLSVHGRILGAITVGRRAGFYTNAEVSLLEDLARRGALALDNALRFKEAQESALTLQRSLLLAHPPALEGVEIAMEYRPGTAGTEVGGDLYDVIPLSGGRVGVAIGDVMGRGLRAAAVMGQLRAALRAYALEDWCPAEVLTRLDRVVGLLPGLQLATCIYAVYDRHTGRATIANAGHPAPLVILPDEDPDYLVLDPGLPLGVGDGGGFTETTVTLRPGSALVMFTDGLVESRRRPLVDGLENLRCGLIEQRARVAAARSGLAAADGTPDDDRRATAADGGAAGAAAGGPSGASTGVWIDRRAPGPSLGPPPGMADRRSGRERRTGPDRRAGENLRAGGDRRAGADRRRRTRGDSFAARSWFGPDTVAGTGEGPTEETARSLLERCLIAADLPARTDDDTAVLVLTTQSVNPPLLELALPAVAASAGQARMAMRDVMLDYGITAVDDATLLVSEVVTNAVLHARSDLVLRASLEPGRLRISVEDREGGHLPRPGAAAENKPDPESGWGLLLVEALSLAWGVETTPGGKRVWFDIEIPDVPGGGVMGRLPAGSEPPPGADPPGRGAFPPDPPAQGRGQT